MAQKRMGRPPVEHPLRDRIFVLVSEETKQKLAECKAALGATTSDIVRKGIDLVHDSLKK